MKSSKYLLIIPLFLMMGACEENLDLYPKTTLSEGTYYKDLPQIQSAANDVYRQMGRLYDAFSIPSLYGMLFSDNGAVIAQLAGTPIDEPIDRHEIFSDNPRIENAWDVAYNAIYICNNIIHQLEITDLEINQELKSRMFAEAKFVRSLAYFNLVRAFGAIPLITEKIQPPQAYDYLREAPEKVYEQLVHYLTVAKEDLPQSYSGDDIGRLTSYGAAAVLAKIHLTLGNTTAAASELEYIINSGQYSLDADGNGTVNASDYDFIFAPETKNSKESVVEVQYLAGANAVNSNHQEAFSPYLDGFNHPLIGSSITRGLGVNTPTDDLASAFEAGDPRKDVTVVPGFNSLSTGSFIEYPFTLKYFHPNWFNPGQNFEVIRFADILLMYTEVTQNPEYLNRVRERVGLAPYGSNEYPSDLYPTLDLAIEHERRVELGMEMHRFFDLVRTGRVNEVMQGKAPGFDSEKILFPIPLYAIDVNPGLTQNPGY